ncbi:hypothetical protein P3T76_004024 [Phytophthora citrophthora]|uniref:Uncharacterized protein n=1 Tax=Phytophthora citrophthora TaxID=4793 RepID=A0AAD9GSZ9_9STRA|nr:hypothetical protein P3T76_004024 [Phytophthora citrophthora]
MEKRRHKVCNTPFAYVTEDASANACEVNFVDPYQRIVDTRAYLDANILLIRALSTIPTRPAFQNALAQAMDLLRLLPADTSAGIRYIIPTFQLLLGQYQDAYDFIKW